MVAFVYNWGGTYAPTGKPMRLNGIDFLRIKDGKIVEFVLTWSTLSWMQQMGVVPAEGEVLPEEPWGVTLGQTSTTPSENRLLSASAAAAINECQHRFEVSTNHRDRMSPERRTAGPPTAGAT